MRKPRGAAAEPSRRTSQPWRAARSRLHLPSSLRRGARRRDHAEEGGDADGGEQVAAASTAAKPARRTSMGTTMMPPPTPNSALKKPPRGRCRRMPTGSGAPTARPYSARRDGRSSRAASRSARPERDRPRRRRTLAPSWPARSLRRFPRRPALSWRAWSIATCSWLRQRPDGGRSEPSRRSGGHPLRRESTGSSWSPRPNSRPHRRVQGRGRPGGRGQAADALVLQGGSDEAAARGELERVAARARGWPRRPVGRKVLEIRPVRCRRQGHGRAPPRGSGREPGALRRRRHDRSGRSPLWRGPTSTASSVWQSSRVKDPGGS